MTGRRTSGLLIITATLITLRTVVSLAAGSTFLYFLQPIISDTVVGTTFLLSLAPRGRWSPGWPVTSTR